MPRTVDPERHRERRAVILAAALREFAAQGFERTSTAAICRAAGISSGTLFHYFPTKLDVLVGILCEGADATAGRTERIEAEQPPERVLEEFLRTYESDLREPSFAGFVHAVAGVERLPEVAAVLAAERRTTVDFLQRTLTAGVAARRVRGDVEPRVLAGWIQWLLDGAATAAAGPPDEGLGDLVAAVHALVGRPGMGRPRVGR